MTEGGPSIERVVATYLKIRDARKARKAEFETEDRRLAEKLETLEGYLYGRLTAMGVESARTEHGTVYQTTDIIPRGSDWNAFYAWVAENGAFDALEKRIKKTFIATYLEENDGELPPGVSVFRQHTVNVRRGNKE